MLTELQNHLAKIADLQGAMALLDWEQQTYMPSGGAEARAHQLSTLSEIAHRMKTDPRIGEWLSALEAQAGQWAYDSDTAGLLRVARHNYDRATKVPAELAAEITRVTTLSQQAWVSARKANDYAAFKPHLAQVIALTRQYAACFSTSAPIYDTLLGDYERDTTAADIQGMFDGIKHELIDLVQAVAKRNRPADRAILERSYGVVGQRKLSRLVSERIGYDYQRGRSDEVAHPFCTSFSINDVRITTRYLKNWLSSGLFGTLHESGHAMYEQGSAQNLERTPLAGGTSLGIHESQSRLWENIVGRSKPFWLWAYPFAQKIFPRQLGDVSLDQFYRAINYVQPSLIRVEADEVTYNLHIMVRFELEQALLNDQISLDDLPAAWNDKYTHYLGITPPNDKDGVLQDVHWSVGYLAYFPTYSIGNLLSAQFYAQAEKDLPGLSDDFAQGKFERLLGWLQTHIYTHGGKFSPKEIVQRVTGGGMSAQPYLDYLKGKYGG
jgi:carboxypeptidase Taq